jgi:hypothetical protein
VRKVQKDRRAPKVFEAYRGFRDPAVSRGFAVSQACKVETDRRDFRAPSAASVPRDFKERPGPRVHRAPLEIRAPRVHRERQVRQDFKAHRGSRVRDSMEL